MLSFLEREFSPDELSLIQDRPLWGPQGLRRELGAISFRYFRDAYFHRWMVDEKTGAYIPPAAFHDDLAAEFERIISSSGGNRGAWAAPRGSAKSTTIDVFFVAWCVLYGYKRYILVIMDTLDQAKLQLAALKDELENNEAILADFGSLKGPVWQEDTIVTANDVRVEALGAGMKIRGRRYKEHRPDLILCDDLENDENVATPGQREKLEKWFWKAVDKAGDSRTDIFVLGTILHYDSLLTKLLKHHRYQARKYKALITEPKRRDLWDRWQAIYTDLSLEDRAEAAWEFYQEHQAEMDEGAEVLWSEKESLYDLKVQQVDDPISFASEKQNEPLNLEDCDFDETWFRTVDSVNEFEYEIYGACDPSLGKSGKRGDYSAIVEVAVHKKTGQMIALEGDLARRHPDQIIKDLIAKAKRRMLEGRPYEAFGVETNQFQQFFKDVLAKESQKERVYLPIVEITHTSDKAMRIQRLQPDIRNGYLAFLSRLKGGLLWNQLKYFPLADHDDGPDALEMAVDLAKHRRRAKGYSGKPAGW